MHYVLKRFRDRDAEYEDLFQYGCMGLLKAVDRFDPAYNVRFSTYAVPIILGEVRRYLRDNHSVHISRTIHDNAQRLERFRQEWFGLHGCEPQLEEICEGLQLDREAVLLALNARQRIRSLSEPVGTDKNLRLMDTLGEEPMLDVDARLTLAHMIAQLKPEERSLLIRRYFHAHTQSAIAKDMGISQVQVSRLEKRILQQLRQCVQGV